MTLASSGTLFLGPTSTSGAARNITYELTGAYGANELSTALTKKLDGGTNISDFYGYKHYINPPAPTQMAVGVYDSVNDRFNLSWSNTAGLVGPPSSEPASTVIQYSTTSSTTGFNLITTSNIPNTTYVWNRACDDLFYYFRAQHKNLAGTSNYNTQTTPEKAVCCLLGNHSLMVNPGVYVNIKDLGVDDMLYTGPQHAPRELDYYRITKYEKNPITSYYKLKFKDDSIIKCSLSHKFMCDGGDKFIDQIEIGDSVLQIKDDIIIELQLIEKLIIYENEYVYNIDVAQAHTYVTENGIIQHNEK